MRNEELGIRNEKKGKKDKKAMVGGQRSAVNGQRSAVDLLDGDWDVVESDGMVFAVEKCWVDVVDECRKRLNVMMFGVPMFEVKGKDLIPQTALAMSDVLKRGVYPEADLSYDEAIAFLRKEAIVLGADVPRGFVMVTYEGVPLGWVKNIGNRSNNLYPEYWRIRN